jgi:hypothetical protein
LHLKDTEMPIPPKDNLDLFANDLFGSTALTPNGVTPIGLIRIPMKEDPNEPDENAHLYDDAETVAPPAKTSREKPAIEARNFRLPGTRNLAAGWKSRAQDNLSAIRLMQQIEEERISPPNWRRWSRPRNGRA